MTDKHEIEVAAAIPLTVEQVLERTEKIHALLARAMKKDVHYGKIPGCGDKPVLLQPGAQKLALMFRLTARKTETRTDLDGGHREYDTTIDLVDQVSGVTVAVGVGVCSTMESKYRYRSGPKESTGELVPPEYWERRKLDPIGALNMIGGPGYQALKDDSGQWTIHVKGSRVEHDNPADYYNTARKMAFKRAYVHAAIGATAASDIFSQDLDPDELGNQAPDEKKEPSRPRSKSANGGSAQGTQSAGSDSPKGARTISAKQVERWSLKCKYGPRSDEQASEKLAYHGFANADAITVDVYDKLCAWADGADE